MSKKELILEVVEGGCIVPTSHSLNHDGYFRKRVGGNLVMYHRHCWERDIGSIPEDYEINHKCHNRACCNVEHLECIHGSDHAILTNIERSPRVAKMKAYWLEHNCTGTHLGEVFGINFGTACRHIRNWKA